MEKPNIDECATLCRAALRRNLQKIIVSIGVMFILGNCSSLLALGALAVFAGRLSLFFCIALLVFLYTLFFGFAVLSLRFVRRERAVIGDLFCGFRSFKRTALSSLPFLLVLFAAVFACSFASVFLAMRAENADAFALLVGEGKMSPLFTGTAFAALGISLVFWLPLAFTPFFVAEKPNYSVRECVSASFGLFKDAWRVLCGAFARLCWKLLAAVAASALAMLCFSGESSLAFLGVLATPVLSLSLYAIFACTVTLYAAVFSECLRLNSAPPSPPVLELSAAASSAGASLPPNAEGAVSTELSASAGESSNTESSASAGSSSNAAGTGEVAILESSSNAESVSGSADAGNAEVSANVNEANDVASAGGAEASNNSNDENANGGEQPLS